MADTYSDFSDVCVKFYDLVVDPEQVASFVYEKIAQFNPRNCLFVGGFFLVAKELQKLGLNIVATDYTEAMVREGHDRLENTRIICADLRELPFNGCFDIVLTVGRVFTHMLNPEDSSRALQSIHRALKPGGAVLVDNYEDSKIQVTDYFNARVTVHDAGVRITRDSSTGLISCDPLVVRWKALYRVTSAAGVSTFEDEMLHRAFSRKEMKLLFEEAGFAVHSQGDNFDESSFFTLACRE